ncbi:hypothetical protein [Marinifaba aquimaris]|uniref:hypothetical protein n=1 Tax=Marinifaba aquimaris TaxID=2741323 RepID=UPI001573F2D6|nr:hypothetical protein [Marinifaba aquimaris]
MTDMPKYVQSGDWIFEVKAVRAIKVSEYGLPYDAIANISVQGDVAYIDGLMTKTEDDFTKKDQYTIRQFCQGLGIRQVSFDRFKDGELINYHFDISPEFELKLVK